MEIKGFNEIAGEDEMTAFDKCLDELEGMQAIRRAKAEKNGITVVQYVALEDFAAKHGRTWKIELRDLWMGRHGGASGELQRLRNTKGISWIVKFKF